MFPTKDVEKIKTHISCSVHFFPKIVPFMRLCGKYGRVEQATDDNIIRRMRILCGYRHTLRICNNYSFSTVIMVTRTRLNVTLYVHYLARLLLLRGGVRLCLLGTAASNGWQNDGWYGKTEVRTYLTIRPGAPFLTVMSHIDSAGSKTMTAGWEESYNWPEVRYSLFKFILKISLDDWILSRQQTRG